MKDHICQPDEKIADVDSVEVKIDGSVEAIAIRGRVYKCNKCGKRFFILEDYILEGVKCLNCCREEVARIFGGKGYCQKCWEEYCDRNQKG